MNIDQIAQTAAIDTQLIYTVFGTLCAAIVFMAGGFIYVYKKMECKLSETESLLIKYIKQHTQVEALYEELKSEHKLLLEEHKALIIRNRDS